MQSNKFFSAARFLRRLSAASSVLALTAAALPAQSTAISPDKPTPAKIEKQFILFPDSVVQEQWPHTLKLVNAPQNLKLLNPGQCIRVGIVATGDGRDGYLEKTQLSFSVDFAGHVDSHPLSPLAATKQIKPEGGDFVTAALNAANIQNPLLTLASLGASADKWCVPADAQDGTATVEAEIESPSGHQKQIPTRIQIESFETGSKRTFKATEDPNDFFMNYHWQPHPARLFPAVQSLAADKRRTSEKPEDLESVAAAFAAALKANPTATKDFTGRISTQSGFTRAFGLLVLLNAGYDIGPVLKTMSQEDRQMLTQHPDLPDPFDFSHVESIGMLQDMLWGKFMTTGEFAPIRQIASALAWRSDWDDLEKARKSSNPPKEWTPAIGRAVGYSAAGWSLCSFQHSDPLAADYIEYMLASPDTSLAIKSELKGLFTNPAFQRSKE
jgi:hypothetical protein